MDPQAERSRQGEQGVHRGVVLSGFQPRHHRLPPAQQGGQRGLAEPVLGPVPDHLWVPKTCATWADALRNAVGSVKRSASAGRSWLGRRWDDLRLVGLKLIFLVVSRAASLLRLSRREP